MHPVGDLVLPCNTFRMLVFFVFQWFPAFSGHWVFFGLSRDLRILGNDTVMGIVEECPE